MLVKHWQSKSYGLWLNKEIVVSLDKSSQNYDLGLTGDQACYSSDLVKTEISTAGSATDTSIEVDSTTGMLAGDIIGIELDAGTMDWTVIASVTDSDTLVIETGLTSAAAVDNHVPCPMPGLVVDILVSKGDRVYRGQDLVSIESMKMESFVASPCDGLVDEVVVKLGQAVEAGDTLLTFKSP